MRARTPRASAPWRAPARNNGTGASPRMTRYPQAIVVALAAALAWPAGASAQQPTDQRRVDSLAAEVRILKARLDSLRAQVARRPAAAEAAADTSLAALRAQAAAAVGTDTAARADTGTRTKF